MTGQTESVLDVGVPDTCLEQSMAQLRHSISELRRGRATFQALRRSMVQYVNNYDAPNNNSRNYDNNNSDDSNNNNNNTISATSPPADTHWSYPSSVPVSVAPAQRPVTNTFQSHVITMNTDLSQLKQQVTALRAQQFPNNRPEVTTQVPQISPQQHRPPNQDQFQNQQRQTIARALAQETSSAMELADIRSDIDDLREAVARSSQVRARTGNVISKSNSGRQCGHQQQQQQSAQPSRRRVPGQQGSFMQDQIAAATQVQMMEKVKTLEQASKERAAQIESLHHEAKKANKNFKKSMEHNQLLEERILQLTTMRTNEQQSMRHSNDDDGRHVSTHTGALQALHDQVAQIRAESQQWHTLESNLNLQMQRLGTQTQPRERFDAMAATTHRYSADDINCNSTSENIVLRNAVRLAMKEAHTLRVKLGQQTKQQQGNQISKQQQRNDGKRQLRDKNKKKGSVRVQQLEHALQDAERRAKETEYTAKCTAKRADVLVAQFNRLHVLRESNQLVATEYHNAKKSADSVAKVVVLQRTRLVSLQRSRRSAKLKQPTVRTKLDSQLKASRMLLRSEQRDITKEVRRLDQRIVALDAAREHVAQQIDGDAIGKQCATDKLVRQQALARSEIDVIRVKLEAGHMKLSQVETNVAALQKELNVSDLALERALANCEAQTKRSDALHSERDCADEQASQLENELHALLGREARSRGDVDHIEEDTNSILDAIDALRDKSDVNFRYINGMDGADDNGHELNEHIVEQLERETKDALALKRKLDDETNAREIEEERLEEELHVLVQEHTGLARRTDELRETAEVLDEAVAEARVERQAEETERQSQELTRQVEKSEREWQGEEQHHIQIEIERELREIELVQTQLRQAEEGVDRMRRETIKERQSGDAANEALMVMQAKARQLENDVAEAVSTNNARVQAKQAESDFVWDTLQRAVEQVQGEEEEEEE